MRDNRKEPHDEGNFRPVAGTFQQQCANIVALHEAGLTRLREIRKNTGERPIPFVAKIRVWDLLGYAFNREIGKGIMDMDGTINAATLEEKCWEWVDRVAVDSKGQSYPEDLRKRFFDLAYEACSRLGDEPGAPTGQ